MTNKALEAALEAWFANTAKGWLEAMQAATTAYFSALPGEAEVVGSLVQRFTDDGKPFSQSLRFGEVPAAKENERVIPLVTLAALQAVQRERDEALALVSYAEDVSKAVNARAEQAERERDEAVGKSERQWAGWVAEEVARKAAEALVEELKEALEPFALVAEHDISEDEADSDPFRPMPKPFNHAPQITVGDFRRAALALKGGSNG